MEQKFNNMRSGKQWWYCVLVLAGNCTVSNPMCKSCSQRGADKSTLASQRSWEYVACSCLSPRQLPLVPLLFALFRTNFWQNAKNAQTMCSVFVKINLRLSEMLSSRTAVIHPSPGCKHCRMCRCKNIQTVLIPVWKPKMTQDSVTNNNACGKTLQPRTE